MACSADENPRHRSALLEVRGECRRVAPAFGADQIGGETTQAAGPEFEAV